MFASVGFFGVGLLAKRDPCCLATTIGHEPWSPGNHLRAVGERSNKSLHQDVFDLRSDEPPRAHIH